MNTSNNQRDTVTIASRKSLLALKQSEIVKEQLENIFPSICFKIETFSTKGDRILDVSLNKIGDKGLFTKELEIALLNKTADIAVHSLKDMPTKLPDNLILGAITKREDSSDSVVLNSKHKNKTLDKLPDGSLIGTSSLRRVAQLKSKFPQYNFESIRGNLQTRLQKLDDYNTYHFDAIILATSGLERMGLDNRISQRLDENFCLPAVGQGALAVECRENDDFILNLLKHVNHIPTEIRCNAERSFMKVLEGGCQVPIGVSTQIDNNNTLLMNAIVLSLDGSKYIKESISRTNCTIESAIKLGEDLAKQLLLKGAKDILNEINTN